MAYTQSDLDAIEKAIASGERRVRLADKEVEYRSINEMLSARAIITAELEGSARTGMLRINMKTDKGLR